MSNRQPHELWNIYDLDGRRVGGSISIQKLHLVQVDYFRDVAKDGLKVVETSSIVPNMREIVE
jgi:hypothetical protein